MPAVTTVKPAPIVAGPPATTTIAPPKTVPVVPGRRIDLVMAEADPVRTFARADAIRLTKRTALDFSANTGPILVKTESAPAASSATPSDSAPTAPNTPPPVQPETASPEAKKADPLPAPEASAPSIPAAQSRDDDESPFILPPDPVPTNTAPTPTPASAPLMSFSTIFRRKAKMTDLARIVLPPKREDPAPQSSPPGPSAAVIPPAFPISGTAGSMIQEENPQPVRAPALPTIGNFFDAKKPSHAEEKPAESGSAPGPVAQDFPPVQSPPVSNLPEAGPKTDAPPADKPAGTEFAPASTPKTDSAAETPRPESSASSILLEHLSASSGSPEKREFHLANGERILGKVLSETPEAIYIDHDTLGVLTIPRAQLAQRLVEIILINGDRIVGDIMAETPDTLYVRHASLGMLTVPRAQRSTRVVEAILKDGDRILGEVLAETETFTVIRSATLGTVTVPHSKVSMLNRKIEQIQLKALPPSAPEIKDKPSL